jgi:hypothetical protein
MATGPLEGAAARSVLPVTPKDHQDRALADLASMPSTGQGGTEASPDRLFQLYLSEYPLLNLPAGEARDRALADFEIALTLGINLVSRSPDPVRPVRIAPGLWRVDTREPGWKRARREKLAAIDPWFHAIVEEVEFVTTTKVEDWPGGVHPLDGKFHPPGRYPVERRERKSTKRLSVLAPWLLSPQEERDLATGKIDATATNAGKLALLSESQAPIVRADWFLVQIARQLSLRNQQTGAGYYDFLEVKNRGDYFRLVKLNEQDALEFGRVTRAILEKSGVAVNNRQVERKQALGGGHWFTLDVQDPQEDGNALNRIRRGEFRHDAEEHYAPLANGLPATLACNAQGELQASVPDFVGHDTSERNVGRDGRIHPNVSCARCHYRQVLRPIDDWARKTFQAPNVLNFADYQDRLDARRQYFSDLEGILKRDRQDYQLAYLKACGCPLDKPEDLAREAGRLLSLWINAYNDYVEYGVDLDTYARELGTTPAVLSGSLKAVGERLGTLAPALGTFLAPKPGRIPRVTAEELVPIVQAYLRGFQP